LEGELINEEELKETEAKSWNNALHGKTDSKESYKTAQF
jgi:hypothetical protein